MGENKILELLKQVVKKTVGKKKITELLNVAKDSVGMTQGTEGAKIRLMILLENFEQNTKNIL